MESGEWQVEAREQRTLEIGASPMTVKATRFTAWTGGCGRRMVVWLSGRVAEEGGQPHHRRVDPPNVHCHVISGWGKSTPLRPGSGARVRIQGGESHRESARSTTPSRDRRSFGRPTRERSQTRKGDIRGVGNRPDQVLRSDESDDRDKRLKKKKTDQERASMGCSELV